MSVHAATSTVERPQTTGEGRVGGRFKRLSERVVARVAVGIPTRARDRVLGKLRTVPPRMQKVTNQTRLVVELMEDQRNGTYSVRWHSMGLAGAALLYFLSPADLVPDTIPAIGMLDDMLVIALAMRLMRGELKRYCEFKRYDPEDYFA